MRPVARSAVTVFAALVAAIAPSTVATAAPVPADTAAVATCTAPFERGPVAVTRFNWEQRVWYRVCPDDTGSTVEAYVNFGPLSGFNASHVTGCTAHFRLQGAADQYKQNNCTAAAKTGRSFSSGRVSWSGLAYDLYPLLDGWVNIQTGVHYEGDPHSQIRVLK